MKKLKISVALTALVLLPSVSWAAECPSLIKSLRVGQKDAEVRTLQLFLNSVPETQIATTGDGSPGHETDYFGVKTKMAVVKFQEKYANEILAPNGLRKGTGVVGQATRAKLHSLCKGAVLGAATVASAPVDGLEVRADSMQPPQLLAPSGALYVPFTRVSFTAGAADVTVDSITIQRTGLSTDRAFANIELLDEDGLYIGFASFNSNHEATIRDDFTIPAGTTRTLLLAGDMADDLTEHQGERAGLALVAVQASSPVTGLPVVGTTQSMNSTLTIGTGTTLLSGMDPRQNRTRYISDTGIYFSGIRLTAGSKEDLILKSVSWQQNGSASENDLSNVVTVMGGTAYPTEVDERYYTSIFPGGGVRIAKGDSLDIEVRGDLGTTGSNRTVKFDIRDATDLQLLGGTYGFGIYPTPEGNTDSTGNSVFLTSDGTTDGDSLSPFFSGSQVTISPGAITGIGKN